MALLKTAVVGCGKIADGHVEELHKLKTTEVVAVCDRELLMAEQLAVRYGVPSHYDSFERMLAEMKPDVIHITTPPQSHLALAKIAIDAGCHVFVEKPFAMNLDESRELVDRAEHTSRRVTVGYTYLFDPPALRMREIVSRGDLGDPVHVESFFGYDLMGSFGQAVLRNKAHWLHELPGGLFHNNIDHALYKVTEFIRDDQPIVHAFLHQRDGSDSTLADELRIVILGRQCSAYVTFSAHAKPAAQFARIYGTKGTLHVNYAARTVTFEKGTELPSAVGRLLPAFAQSWEYFRAGSKNAVRFLKSDFHYFSGLQTLMQRFYASILNNTPPPISYHEILKISWLVDEVLRQTDRALSRKGK